MKKLFLLLLTTCVIPSCSNNESGEVISTKNNNDGLTLEMLSNEAQRNFIKDIDQINKEFQIPKTKISQKDVAEGFKWILKAGVDGIGGAIGGLAFGWLTGAAASTLYEVYLEKMEQKMTRTSSYYSYEYIDVAKNEEYNELYESLAFRFCDNIPKNTQDSIGYIHNEILNAFMVKNERNYILDNKIDFQSFYSDYKKMVKQLGYSSEYVDTVFNENLNNCFNSTIEALANLHVQTKADNNVFDEIELSLYNNAILKKEDAKFLSLLAKNIILSFPRGMPVERLTSYSEKIKNALKHSELTAENISMCKQFFQTIVCSYIYWKYSKL